MSSALVHALVHFSTRCLSEANNRFAQSEDRKYSVGLPPPFAQTDVRNIRHPNAIPVLRFILRPLAVTCNVILPLN
jgi:hypothetical protein